MTPRLILLFALCYGFTIAACNDPTDIGQGVIEEDEFFNTEYIDTFSIRAHLLKTDSTFTAPAGAMPLGYMLGALNEPALGRTIASMYAQLGITGTSINLGDSLVLDSIVLSLAYNTPQLYGDSTSRHNVSVYEVEEPIGTGAYYADQHFAYNTTPIGYRNQVMFDRWSGVPVRKYRKYTKIEGTDTIPNFEEIDTITLAPQLRVRLNDELGWRILSRSGTQELKSTTAFQQFFKGIYVTTSGFGNSIAFISINTNSAITVYYHNGSEKGLLFTLNLSGGVVNNLDHRYTSTPVETAFNSPYPNGQEYLYIQGANGTHFEFDVPSFAALSGKIINKAELEMTLLPELDSTYRSPTKLTTYAIDSTGRKLFLQEYPASRITTPTYLPHYGQDGTTAEGIKIYKHTLNYRDFVQELMTGKFVKFGVEIPDYIPSRAIICGPEHPQYPMRWRVYYTEPQ